MGIQSWKRGLHSGNTVRKGDPFIARKQREPPGLVRRNFATATTTAPAVVNNQDTTDEEPKKSRRRGRRTKKTKQHSDNSYESVAFDELDNFRENVFYSLNKRGRWNLPEEIRREITYTNNSVRDGGKLKRNTILVERHNQKSGSNCIGLSSTKLPGDGCVSKSKTYINSESILKRDKKPKRKKPKKSSRPECEGETVEDLPEVQLEVSYPISGFKCSEKMCNTRWIYKSLKENVLIGDDIHDDISCFCNDDWSDCEWCEDNTDSHRDCESKRQQNGKDESEKKPYIWFLKEFVSVDIEEVADSETDGEKEEEEKEEEKEIYVSNVYEDDCLWGNDWDVLNDAAISQEKEVPSGELGFLGQLIDAALIRKMSKTSNSMTQRQKSKRRKRTKTTSNSKSS